MYPLAGVLCFLVVVFAVRGVGRGGLVPLRLVEGLSGIFLVSLQSFQVLEQKRQPRIASRFFGMLVL